MATVRCSGSHTKLDGPEADSLTYVESRVSQSVQFGGHTFAWNYPGSELPI